MLMEFYAAWCPACKHFQPHYEKAWPQSSLSVQQVPLSQHAVADEVLAVISNCMGLLL